MLFLHKLPEIFKFLFLKSQCGCLTLLNPSGSHLILTGLKVIKQKLKINSANNKKTDAMFSEKGRYHFPAIKSVGKKMMIFYFGIE